MYIDKQNNTIHIKLSLNESHNLYSILDFYRKHNPNFHSDVWCDGTNAQIVSDMQGSLWKVLGGE